MLRNKQATGSGWKRDGEDFLFDIFRGNRIHTTELLDSPLDEGRHSILMEFSHLYFEDCLELAEARREEIDIERRIHHF